MLWIIDIYPAEMVGILFFLYFCILECMMLGFRRGLLRLLVGCGGVADLPGWGIGRA